MAYSGQFLKVTFLFDVDGSEEIADTGINFTTAPGWEGAGAALDELTTGAVGPDLIGNMNALMSISELRWATYSNLVAVKVAAKGTDGKDLQSPYVYEATTSISGGSTASLPQATVVASLRTGLTFGGGNYGRMYLPHTSMVLATSVPYSDSSITDPIAAAVKTFINDTTDDINGLITAIVFPAIMSQATPPTGKGVSQVAVGNVTDTQRRRRNRLVEVYSFEDLA